MAFPNGRCEVCGGRTPTPSRFTCSPECGADRKRRVDRDRFRARHDKPVARVCVTCGGAFETTCPDGRRTFCSLACSRRMAERKASRARAERRRKRREGRRVAALAIFERDRWRCQLCGRRTPKALRGTTADEAPELDHIIPLAAGGEHVPWNTQCACRECNHRKGARTQGQLRLALAVGGIA